jgi:hypothetical protein
MAQLTSLQTKVAGQILSAIQSGDLQPGTHLKEVELSQRLGVSRSPIRCRNRAFAYRCKPLRCCRNSSMSCTTKKTSFTPG